MESRHPGRALRRVERDGCTVRARLRRLHAERRDAMASHVHLHPGHERVPRDRSRGEVVDTLEDGGDEMTSSVDDRNGIVGVRTLDDHSDSFITVTDLKASWDGETLAIDGD